MTFGDGRAAPNGIVTIGEILVEIMATEAGLGFREPISLVGPFPSGAPAIFIDQVGKLGFPAGIVSCVGGDDFARVNLERLRGDGVDVSAIEIPPRRPAAPSSVTAPKATATSSTTSATAPAARPA